MAWLGPLVGLAIALASVCAYGIRMGYHGRLMQSLALRKTLHVLRRPLQSGSLELDEALLRGQLKAVSSSESGADDGTEGAPAQAPLQSFAIETIDEERPPPTADGEEATGSDTQQSARQSSTETPTPPSTATNGPSSSDGSGSCGEAATNSRSGTG